MAGHAVQHGRVRVRGHFTVNRAPSLHGQRALQQERELSLYRDALRFGDALPKHEAGALHGAALDIASRKEWAFTLSVAAGLSCCPL